MLARLHNVKHRWTAGILALAIAATPQLAHAEEDPEYPKISFFDELLYSGPVSWAGYFIILACIGCVILFPKTFINRFGSLLTLSPSVIGGALIILNLQGFRSGLSMNCDLPAAADRLSLFCIRLILFGIISSALCLLITSIRTRSQS
jgi:hypothetical protein